MGKQSRGKAQRRTAPPTDSVPVPGAATPEDSVRAAHPIIAAVEDYMRAAAKLAEAAGMYEHDLSMVRLPNLLDYVVNAVTSGEAVAEMEQLLAAWTVVDSDRPVAAMVPPRRVEAGEGRRWLGPLTPIEILHQAEIAAVSDAGYRDQLQVNMRYHTAVEAARIEQQQAVCGRQTVAGTPCESLPLYMPPDGFMSGYPCWRHVGDKADVVRGCYARAVAEHDCPGCTATAGRPCLVGEENRRHLRLVNGEWPRERTYAGSRVHDFRLLLVSLPHP